MRSRRRVLHAALAVLAVAAAPAPAQTTAQTTAQQPAPQGASPAPVFPDLELAGAEGGALRLSQLKGNVVLLNVWATWCGPCRMELPIVQKLYDKYSDRNFVILAVNVDADRQRVDPFLKRYNISLPVYYAAPEDAGQMTAMGIPTTFLLSGERRVLDSQVGYAPEVEEHWKQLIEKNSRPRKAPPH